MKALYGALPLTIDKTDSLALRAEHGACGTVRVAWSSSSPPACGVCSGISCACEIDVHSL